MTTRYERFEDNDKVMDVLFALIIGENTVKGIMKRIKQPQQTVSGKLKFLIDSNVVIKKKWKFEVNWKELHKKCSKTAVEVLKELSKTRNFKMKIDVKSIMTEKVVKELFTMHSKLHFKFKSKILAPYTVVREFILALG
jgi:hypothetical protein